MKPRTSELLCLNRSRSSAHLSLFSVKSVLEPLGSIVWQPPVCTTASFCRQLIILVVLGSSPWLCSAWGAPFLLWLPWPHPPVWWRPCDGASSCFLPVGSSITDASVLFKQICTLRLCIFQRLFFTEGTALRGKGTLQPKVYTLVWSDKIHLLFWFLK